MNLLPTSAVIVILCLTAGLSPAPASAQAQNAGLAFTGEKTSWHEGFDRYDFLMDTMTCALTPIRADEQEKTGAKPAEKGKLRCIVIVPKKAAPGNPWSWQGCYWDYEPQTEVELLRRGFHIAFIMCDPDRHWDAWYAFLTEKHGLSPKPAFVGMSKGGINEFAWATTHPDKVSCIYADNPALRPESFQKLDQLAAHDVPLLHVCGSYDFLLERHTLPVEEIYHRLGGRISVMIKEGPGHHPHSIKDPALIAGWIENNIHPESGTPPPLPGLSFDKSYYYSYASSYPYLQSEDTYAACRGPLFTPCYDRYDVKATSWLGITGMTIIMPKQPAAGNPWVFRADRIGWEAEPVDLALLAKGYTIVAAPVTEQVGPVRKQWDDLYKLLTSQGYSRKPVMEGTGAGGGEAYYWAIGNPDKVSCIYAYNPVLRSLQAKGSLVDSLAPLAKAHIPIIHVCGSLDPWYAANTMAAQKVYQQSGGHMEVLVIKGAGHFDALPSDPTPIVDFIVANGTTAAQPSSPLIPAHPGLLAGTSKINITPHTDEPIHDSVYARTLVLDENGIRLAFVSVDLAVFTSERIEQACLEKYGITHLMLCSSHNHSEPQPGGKRSFQPGNPFTAFYEDQIIRAVGESVNHLFPARISAGRNSFPQLGFNRLIPREDGHARESWFSDDHYTSENPERIPFGPVDPEVGVLRIDDTAGHPRAIVMNYACHADIVCFNYAVSADYPGVACRKVEEAFGHQVNCLFVQGAGGNIESLQISSRRKGPDDPFQTDYRPMERTGELLAFQVIKLARSLGGPERLPAQSQTSPALQYVDDSLHFTGRFNKNLDFNVHLSTIIIDHTIAIAACPGELFVQLQLDWKQKMELAGVQPFLFGYTWSEGSWPGYIADVRSAALGGYGADQGDNLIEVGAGESIMARQLADFYRLDGLMRNQPGPTGFKSGAQWIVKPFNPPSTPNQDTHE
jgi:hypothetical protein